MGNQDMLTQLQLDEVKDAFASRFEIAKTFPGGTVSFRLRRTYLPISMSVHEAGAIAAVISRQRLRRGCEIATGTGFSSCCVTYVLSKLLSDSADFQLITIDSYVEEVTQDFDNPRSASFCSEPKRANGFKNILALIESLGLQGKILPFVGLSPNDVPEVMQKSGIQPGELSFVIIDAQHNADFPTKDFMGLRTYLSPNRSVVFWHDTHADAVVEAVNVAAGFGWRYGIRISGVDDGYNLIATANYPEFSPTEIHTILKLRNRTARQIVIDSKKYSSAYSYGKALLMDLVRPHYVKSRLLLKRLIRK